MQAPPPCLLLTRPQQDAQRFADQARAEGWAGDILISPLLEIILYPPPEADLAHARSLVLTSQHGVAALAGATLRRDWPVWAVGPRTAQAARAAGFAQVHEAGGDAAALLRDLVQNPPPPPVLHLRGAHVATDIAQVLQDKGQHAEGIVVYAQLPCALSPAACARLEAGGDVVLPVFSPRSAQLLAKALAGVSHAQTRLHPVAISAAAAAPLDGLGLMPCQIATRPDMPAMCAALAATQAKLEPWAKPR
jgi:uroporphyrinogen-III synthase